MGEDGTTMNDLIMMMMAAQHAGMVEAMTEEEKKQDYIGMQERGERCTKCSAKGRCMLFAPYADIADAPDVIATLTERGLIEPAHPEWHEANESAATSEFHLFDDED